MKDIAIWIVIGLAVAAAIVVAFVPRGEVSADSDSYFTCPMHPAIRLPRQGECPICGMSLVEKKAGEVTEKGSIALTPRQVQLAGVRTEKIAKRKLVSMIDTVGRIDVDERRMATVAAWVDGRIDTLHIDYTGATIEKGHPLADLYSPSLISAQEEYLQAIGAAGKLVNAGDLVKSARQRLVWWGLSQKQVDEIAESGKVRSHLTIHAPLGGTVLHKHVVAGQYVKTGDTLFRIADLTEVWMYADIYESEVPSILTPREGDFWQCPMHPEEKGKEGDKCPKCGMPLLRQSPSIRLEITTGSWPGEVFEGTLEFADPFVNPQTRTIRVRSTIKNGDLRLRPDMYVRARATLSEGALLAVPEGAVIFSGQRRIVLVDEGGGKFRPALVKLGRKWLWEDGYAPSEAKALPFHRGMQRYHEVLEGLKEGDVVVASGNFLINSEAQLQGALDRIAGEEKKPKPTGAEHEGIRGIFEGYLKIHKAVAKDELEHVGHMAHALAGKAKIEPIRDALGALAKASGPEAIRKEFAAVSNALIDYWKEFGPPAGLDVHVAYCPMVKKHWLQEGEDISNPYDLSMSGCGTIEDPK